MTSTRRSLTPAQLRRRIAALSPAQPATHRFTRAWLAKPGVQREQRDVWYSTQQEHWLGWLKEMNGPGYYGRRASPKNAGTVYNRIVNPQMLVYLAEAAGVSPALVSYASDEALKARTMPAMCAALRRFIPWVVVEEALLARRRPRKQRRTR